MDFCCSSFLIFCVIGRLKKQLRYIGFIIFIIIIGILFYYYRRCFCFLFLVYMFCKNIFVQSVCIDFNFATIYM